MSRKACRRCAATGFCSAGTWRRLTDAPRPAKDDGFLSSTHAEHAARSETSHSAFRAPHFPKRRPLRASAGHPVTQLQYARQGIIAGNGIHRHPGKHENCGSRIANCGFIRRFEAGIDLSRSSMKGRRSNQFKIRNPKLQMPSPLRCSAGSRSGYRRRSRRSLCGVKWRRAGRLFPRTSIIRRTSR